MDWFHVNSASWGSARSLSSWPVRWPGTSRGRAEQKNQNADKQLLAAKQSVAAGNTQLAESDLKKVADRYAGTPAGTEAGMLLGQIRLEKGDAAAAVSASGISPGR